MYLRNVHPSKSLSSRISTRPQEPRRPRFSFFFLHNVNDLTSLPSPARTSFGSSASVFVQGKQSPVRLPGRSSALSEIAEQWERLALGVVNVAGYSRNVSVRQHPISSFVFIRNSKPETSNCSAVSVACFRAHRRLAPRSSAMGGL